MPHTGYSGSPDQQAAQRAPAAGNAALAAAGAAGGTQYLTQLYNNSQSVNNQGRPGYDANGQPIPGSGAADAIQGGQAQTIAGTNLTMAQLLQQIGLAVPGVNEQNLSNTLGLEYGLGQAGIGEQQLDLQRSGLGAQLGLNQAQQGYEVAGYNLQQQQYPEQLQAQALANQQSKQQLQSSQAIGDTAFTQGGKLNQQSQALQAKDSIADIQRAQAESQLQQGSEVAGYNYSAGDIARSQQNLDLTAQANGLSVQQMMAQWQQGLEQTGLTGDPLQAYTQYLASQTQGIQGAGTAAGQEGLLTPSQMSNAAMHGGFNPMSLFAGNVS